MREFNSVKLTNGITFRQVGPPDSMREHLVSAAKAMMKADWKTCADTLLGNNQFIPFFLINIFLNVTDDY